MKLKPTRVPISPEVVARFTENLFGEDLHAKRLRSLQDSILGTLHAAQLGISAIGHGLAAIRGLNDKHAIKQVDRWLSNAHFQPWQLAGVWVPYCLRNLNDVFINLDWTDFDADGHTTIYAALQTGHGRAEPLLWKTVHKDTLKDRRNEYEDDLLRRLSEIVPENLRVTIVADRGFGDQKLFEFLLNELGFDYIIRLRGNIKVRSIEGECRLSSEWTGQNGRMRVLRRAQVTADKYEVPLVVCVQEKGMKDVWCLVSSRNDLTGAAIKKRYGKRFSIEELFRDFKDIRFGMGLSWTSISDPARRDRLLFVAMIAYMLLTILGASGEAAGLDRMLKPSTTQKRVYSLFRQGVMWYERIPNMPEARLLLLLQHFNLTLEQDPHLRDLAQSLDF